MWPVFSSMMRSTRASTRARVPQNGSISALKRSPRMASLRSSVASISLCERISTMSPGARTSGSWVRRSPVAKNHGQVRPSWMRSARGRRRLAACHLLNARTSSPRAVSRTRALRETTSATQGVRRRAETKELASSSSVAWHDHTGCSSVEPGPAVASTRTAGGSGCGSAAGARSACPCAGTRSSHASFQYTRHRAWQPSWLEPSQRRPARWTTSARARVVPPVPPVLTVSQVRWTTASTTSVRPR